MNNLSTPTKIATGLLFALGITNIILVYISLTEPVSSSEFAALHNVAMGLYATIVGVLSALLIIFSIFLLKQKRWAFFLSIIFTAFLIAVLAVSDLKEIGFNLTPGAGISITKEVWPIAILLLLILGRKDFRKVQTSK